MQDFVGSYYTRKRSKIKGFRAWNPWNFRLIRTHGLPTKNGLKTGKKREFGENGENSERTAPHVPLELPAPSKIFGENFAPTSAVDHSIVKEVQPMITEKYCQEVLTEYPEYITKEQMYRICHISKKTCLFLLQSGLVPNIDSGRKTRRYKIKTTDVLQYLRDRDDYPELYKAPDGFYKNAGCKKAPSFDEVFKKGDLIPMRKYYEKCLISYPDVMSIEQVAEFTGYCKTSVRAWCSKQEVKCFLIRQRFQIPKECLLDFLVSKYFIGIAVKSDEHKEL